VGRPRRAGLRLFGRLPIPVRRALVRAGTPSFTLGCVAVIRHRDRILMVRQRHRGGWSLPGGLIKLGETPEDCIRRELGEELGLRPELAEQVPLVVVDASARRIDLIFLLGVEQRPEVRLTDGEVLEADWRLPGEPALDRPTAAAIRVASRGR
jgi:8-oxo-dGTP diphosphatase